MSDMERIKDVVNQHSRVIKQQQEQIKELQSCVAFLMDDPDHSIDAIATRKRRMENFKKGFETGLKEYGNK